MSKSVKVSDFFLNFLLRKVLFCCLLPIYMDPITLSFQKILIFPDKVMFFPMIQKMLNNIDGYL